MIVSGNLNAILQQSNITLLRHYISGTRLAVVFLANQISSKLGKLNPTVKPEHLELCEFFQHPHLQDHRLSQIKTFLNIKNTSPCATAPKPKLKCWISHIPHSQTQIMIKAMPVIPKQTHRIPLIFIPAIYKTPIFTSPKPLSTLTCWPTLSPTQTKVLSPRMNLALVPYSVVVLPFKTLRLLAENVLKIGWTH